MRVPVPVALLLSALAFSCHHKPPPPLPAGLVAVVQRLDGLVVQRFSSGRWKPEKKLPLDARALRFSADGATVAWVVDEQVGGDIVPRGYWLGSRDEKPHVLGPLGLRKRQAMGLAVASGGRVAWLDFNGKLVAVPGGRILGDGSDVVLSEQGEEAFVDGTGCLQAPSLGVSGALCGGALAPLTYAGGMLLARDNRGVVEVRRDGVARVNVSGVLDARIRRRGELLLVQRVNGPQAPMDAVALYRPAEPMLEVTRAAVIVSARFDADGSVLVVRALGRANVYELMLSHAPEELGGEALAGEAVRFSPVHLQESPVAGLELERVRALFYATAEQQPPGS